ncbi:ABC transporter permease [Streptomyces sp. enrichment culture]|uniref:ABC transporter permease n=1 Tax=Streptomyces sp. enrichment culture TaxID=1795815 RepID=UPI003F57EE5B
MPVALAVPALLAIAFLLVPLLGILTRTRWGELGSHLSSEGVTEAVKLSLLVSCGALALSLVLGVPLAWLLARVDFPGKALVRSLVLLPMVLPPTVGGVALLLGFGRRGLLGPWLEDTFGIVLPFHTSGAVVAATFVAMPFLVISLEGTLAGLRPAYEETAASLGASPVRVFCTVTLPLVAPGLAAGAALTWARALGEFGATITFAGNLPGTTQTLPLQVYLLLQDQPEAATSVSLLLLVIAMAVLVALRGRWAGGGQRGGDVRGRTRDRRSSRDGDRPKRPTDTATAGAGAAPAKNDPAPPEDRPAPAKNGPVPAEDRPVPVKDGPVPAENSPARAKNAPVPATYGTVPPEDVTGHGPAEPAPTDSGERWPLYASVTGFTELSLDAEPGTTVAVVGPNGAGKTTLLRALLGLTPRARARLVLGATEASALPPHRRGVAWVPQDGALFPHLSALANTAYGLRAQGVRRTEARRRARAWLERLDVGHLAHRRPAQLSGGQAGRVALARALAARPRLLLLDEPLAALDQTTRAHVRHTLRTHLAGFGGVCLLVTHDPVEAVSLADRVLVLEDGRAVQDAPPGEVARHPRSPWVARMLGRNALAGTAAGDGTLLLDDGGRLVVADPVTEGAAVLAVVAPEAVALHRTRPQGSPRNVWPGTVREITAVGSRLRVLVGRPDGPDLVAEVTTQAAAELGLRDGVEVFTSVKATEITLVER